jgi:hypothetical protein
MEVQFRIEANEIEHAPELSVYNNRYWKFTKHNPLGFTHFKEKYDDVSNYPEYFFGVVIDGKFVSQAYGVGDPIPEDRLGFGGVWTEVWIQRPDLDLKVIG